VGRGGLRVSALPKAARGQADRRARHEVPDIVRFLNDWKCGVNTNNTPPMFAAWIRDNADRLEALAHLTIAEPEVLEHLGKIQAIYDSLWGEARANIRTWGPAANAKTLHMLIPGLCAMWDKNIVPFADGYADFMAEMRRLAVRMVEESPYASAEELEQRMQEHLGYAAPETLLVEVDHVVRHRVYEPDHHGDAGCAEREPRAGSHALV
jgi:hypothetical protein